MQQTKYLVLFSGFGGDGRLARATPASLLLGVALLLGSCVEAVFFTPLPPTVPAHRLPMNNAYLGSVRAVSSRPHLLRPTFVWEPSTSAAPGPIHYELQLSKDPDFKIDVITIETFETRYQHDTDLSVSHEPPVGARYFWHVRACQGTNCSDYARRWYANVGRTVTDYNGDGYSDLAIGAPGSDYLAPNAGRVLVLFGKGNTYLPSLDTSLGTLAELSPHRRAGASIRSAGDVNGDGYADLIWGIAGESNLQNGRGYLYLGGRGPALESTPNVTFALENPIQGFAGKAGGVGDLNGDGFDDLFILTEQGTRASAKVYIYYGEPGSSINNTPYGFFEAPQSFSDVSGAGDINGDGYADIIAGYPSDATRGRETGAAYLYLGSKDKTIDSQVDVVLPGRASYDAFGGSVAAAGDVNSDGLSDVLVASISVDDTGDYPIGRVSLFYGGRTFDYQADSTLTISVGHNYFESILRGIGDVDGDGYDDVLIGAPHSDPQAGPDGGRAFLYLGGSNFKEEPHTYFEGMISSAFLGRAAAGGDFNGDGLSDIVIGSPGTTNSEGIVLVYKGTESRAFQNLLYDLVGDVGDLFGEGIAGGVSR
jgi:FG-GAP-like repeat/FG-GAP repeat